MELVKRAENVLKSMEEKDIKIDPAKELSEDYSLATFTSPARMESPVKARSWWH